MKITVLKKGSNSVDFDRSPKDLSSLLNDETNIVWVDISEWGDEAVKVLTDTFHFHPLSIEHALESRHHPFVEDYGSYLSFTIHGVAKEADSHSFITHELDGFLGKNFLVTYHDHSFRSIDHVESLLATSSAAMCRGADFLLYKILDQMIDAYIPVVDDFDDSIDRLEERIFKTNDGQTAILEEIMQLKRSIGRLIRISAKQSSVLYRIASGDLGQISAEARPFFRDVFDHLQRVATMAESHRELIGSLMDVQLSVISNKTNDIMKLLAIFSAVMLPLTLIAGIYGMNITLPDTDHPNAFWHILGVMGVISLFLLIYFRRKGWIRGFRANSANEERGAGSKD